MRASIGLGIKATAESKQQTTGLGMGEQVGEYRRCESKARANGVYLGSAASGEKRSANGSGGAKVNDGGQTQMLGSQTKYSIVDSKRIPINFFSGLCLLLRK